MSARACSAAFAGVKHDRDITNCPIAAMAALICKEERMGNKSQALVINAAALAAIVIISVLLVLALFGPLTAIITSPSK